MTWTVEYKRGPAAHPVAGPVSVELANGKPPYQWRHGWIPLTPDAAAIKSKQKSGTAKDGAGSIRGSLRSESISGTLVEDKPAAARDFMSYSQRRAFEVAKDGGAPVDLPFEVNHAITKEWASSVKVKGELTFEEKDAMNDYQWEEMGQSTYYGALNGHKRGNLASALGKSRTSRPVTVFRGVRDGQPPIAVGDVLTDKAWVSTSYDPDIAHGFAKNGQGGIKSKDNRVLVINLPKGSPALRALDGEEMELILPPDLPLKAVRQDGRYIYMEPA